MKALVKYGQKDGEVELRDVIELKSRFYGNLV